MSRHFPPAPYAGVVLSAAPSPLRRRLRTTAWAALYLLLAWIIGSVAWWFWSYSRWQYVENRDPKEVFWKVFGVPLPPTVRSIKAAGHQPFDGEFWIVIHADDIDGFLKPLGMLKRVDKSALEIYEPTTEDLRRFAASVGWESVHHIKSPEYYQRPDLNHWVMVVDRARHVVYVAVMVS